MVAKGFRATQSFLVLQLETLRDGATLCAMIDVAIHGITSIDLGEINYLESTQTYARAIWIEGVDINGARVTARIPLFAKTKDSLVIRQELALLSQRLDEIISCVKEVE